MVAGALHTICSTSASHVATTQWEQLKSQECPLTIMWEVHQELCGGAVGGVLMCVYGSLGRGGANQLCLAVWPPGFTWTCSTKGSSSVALHTDLSRTWPLDTKVTGQRATMWVAGNLSAWKTWVPGSTRSQPAAHLRSVNKQHQGRGAGEMTRHSPLQCQTMN